MKFLAFWCCEGLESIIPIDQFEPSKADLAEAIKTGNNSAAQAKEMQLSHLLNALRMRARFNPERFYELYAFSTVDGIGEKEVNEWFDSSPQLAVDWIRKNGVPLIEKSGNRKTVIE